MTSISRPHLRLVFIVLALCAVLSVVPLASAQSEPLPMPPAPGEENRSWVFSSFTRFDEAERSNHNTIGMTLATLDGGNSITVTEGGAPVQITIRLNAQPAGTVKLRYMGPLNTIFQPARLTFTRNNWDVPQVVTVYGAQNYFSGDRSYNLVNRDYMAETIINGVHEVVEPSFNRFTINIIDSPSTPPAGPLVVTTLEDSITEEIPGSLRQAILAALVRPEVDTITFEPALTGTIQLVADLFWLPQWRDFSILGSGQNRITIDGGGLHDGFIQPNYTSSKLTIRDLTLSNLSQAIFSGELHLSDVTVQNSGQGATRLDGFPAVTAWYGATITRVTMEGNSGVSGGAMMLSGISDITVSDSTFINNTAYGIPTRYNLLSRGGGAIYTGDTERVDIIRSTFAGNSGAHAGAIGDSFDLGGGGPITISSSTFSANIATQPSGSAAVYIVYSPYNIIFSTFSGHNTGLGSGGVIRGQGGAEASVFANNSADNPVECLGYRGGFLNFSADPNCNWGYHKGIPTGVDPVLRNNGGLTMTHALLPGSNVIDADTRLPNEGNITYCESALGLLYGANDQRGVARPQFGSCDFGAFESDVIPLPSNNLLTNPSFEAAGATEAEALGWTTRNLRPIDRRWCDTLTASDGGCSFRFRGPNLTAAQRRLIQTVTANATWGQVGDTLTLSADIRTREWGAASRLMLTVTYTDGTAETAVVRIPAGTNAYQTLTTSLTLTKPAATATVLVRVKTGGTKQSRLWVDNVVLGSE